MANVSDMEIEIRQSERIALIDSATKLVASFVNRPPAITSELRAYEAALAFLQMQYELEKPCLYVKTDDRAPITRPAQAE